MHLIVEILICIIHLMRKGLQAGVSTLYGHGRFTTRLLSISNLKLQIVKKEISKDLRKLHKLPGRSSLNVKYVCPVCPLRLVCPVCPIYPDCPVSPLCPDDHDDLDDHDYHDDHDDNDCYDDRHHDYHDDHYVTRTENTTQA